MLVRNQCCEVRDSGRPSTRPEQECVVSARQNALCVAPPRVPPSLASLMRLTLSLSIGSAPHASHGRQRFPAVSGRNMAVPLLIAHQRMTIISFIMMKVHQELIYNNTAIKSKAACTMSYQKFLRKFLKVFHEHN
ncbi:unnamed protein product [Pieris brassicae]|uniref:Uncharacterized protein n=1 Tax=Pieris brassicae TaxID=7116 RepID=A0A9P0TU58_PIEBR|nr:unnamed protein product [Pieris brassicae]